MSEVAIVTGAAGGIGSATARRFAAEGVAVVVADIAEEGAARVAQEIEEAGGTAVAARLDVSRRDEWEAAVEVAKGLGKLKHVVNNAGNVLDKTLMKMTDEQWDGVVDVHLKGAFLGSQMGMRAFREHGEGGTIVSVSSVAINGSFGQSNYSAAKGGIVSLMRTVAIEGARHGVRANAVAPGGVHTPMTATMPQSVLEESLAGVPMGRYAEPAELAAVIWFLSSPEASYVTGQVVIVDGGSSLGRP